MTVVLDTGGVGALAGQRARLAALRRRGLWPPVVPAVVLTECLTGDHRRDFHENHVVGLSQVCDVAEPVARAAAALRTATGRAGEISAVDAIVAAVAVDIADTGRPAIVLTSDPDDLTALVAVRTDIAVERV